VKTLIFEGIATSGKSSVISELQKALTGQKVLVAGETKTHEPIMEQRAEKHIEFFTSLINHLTAKKPDLLIFDRLYLTQAFRAKSRVENYDEIEELLSRYTPLTIFLKVNESAIHNRISKATKHRGSDYFKFRGTSEERALYYIEQQRNLLMLLKHSTIPYKIFDTTNHAYQKIAEEIIGLINRD
jgi:thymidylate kinase